MTATTGEFALIEWIRRQAAGHPRLTLGIGDDAAVFRFPKPADALITVDMLLEGVHFAFPPATPALVGRKALGVNLSDIAAMGGTPLAAVISVALPRNGGRELAEGLYAGLQQLATEFNVAIAGGDTNTWHGPLVISVTLLGETHCRGPVLRSGAEPGDWIMVTGEFGGSLTGKHLDFTPRVREAAALLDTVPLHAMMDVSDGLSADLYHILEESSVGAVVREESIPIAPAAVPFEGRTSLERALGDGEDFELLFTLSPADGERLLAAPPFATRLTHIGEITAGPGGQLRRADGTLEPLPRSGWVHPC